MATYEERPFAFGGMQNFKTELLNTESGNYEWDELPSLPSWTDEDGYTHDTR